MRRRTPDAGFTLTELLVAVAILGIVIVPLTAALALAFRTQGETADRMTDSSAAQLVSLWLSKDVQSASSIDALQQTLPTYSSSCAESGDTVVLRLGWTDTDTSSSTTATVVAYVTRTVGGTGELVRLSCTGTSLSNVGSPTASQVLASNVTAASVPACAGACSSVRAATMDITVQTAAEAAQSVSYSFSITAYRRPA